MAILSRWARPTERRSSPPAEESPALVLVHPEVVTAIAAAAGAAGADETGGPLLGTVQREWDGDEFRLTASVLGTVPPGPAVRGGRWSVALGGDADGDRASAALRWLRSATGLDLVHLGDWHKHPARWTQPSRGDLATASAMRADAALPLWLVAIVVTDGVFREDVCEGGYVVGYARESCEWAELRFFRADGLSSFATVPARPESEATPRLPPLPWHVTDPARFTAECRLLDAGGFRLAVDEATPRADVDLTLRVDRNGTRLWAITRPGYPNEPPILVDDRGTRVPVRGWSPERFLVDVVREAGW